MISVVPGTDQAILAYLRGKPIMSRTTFIWCWLGLLLGGAISASLVYFNSKSFLALTPLIATGGLSLAAAAASANKWQRECLRGLQAKEAEWQRTVSALQRQLAESRNAAETVRHTQAEVPDHGGRLEEVNAKLRAELDAMKQAEKN